MIVGIDLGTTNSLVGIWHDGAVELIPNALGHTLTPSAVGLGDDRTILVGLAARERLATHPHHNRFQALHGSRSSLVPRRQRLSAGGTLGAGPAKKR
jgi:molecular chaperone DnaK (HSP70)